MTFTAREIQRTGITSLKVSFNNVFGYYIEVRNTQGTRFCGMDKKQNAGKRRALYHRRIKRI